MKYQSIHEAGEGEGAYEGEINRQLPQRGCCNRCDAPQGRMVTLNNRETVCGACIGRTGNLQAATVRIEMDRTPAIECGFLHEGAPC